MNTALYAVVRGPQTLRAYAKSLMPRLMYWALAQPGQVTDEIEQLLKVQHAHNMMMGRQEDIQTKFRKNRLTLPHDSMATDTVLHPYPKPGETVQTNKEGWGSLGTATKAEGKSKPVHEPKKRTIFRPSKKAIPKLAGQTSIFDFCRTTSSSSTAADGLSAESEEKSK